MQILPKIFSKSGPVFNEKMTYVSTIHIIGPERFAFCLKLFIIEIATSKGNDSGKTFRKRMTLVFPPCRKTAELKLTVEHSVKAIGAGIGAYFSLMRDM